MSAVSFAGLPEPSSCPWRGLLEAISTASSLTVKAGHANALEIRLPPRDEVGRQMWEKSSCERLATAWESTTLSPLARVLYPWTQSLWKQALLPGPGCACK